VISIKKYLSLNCQVDRSWMDAVRVLIEGIAEHVVTGQTDDLARFRETITQASDALVDGIAPEALRTQADSVLKSLAEHNRHITWFQRFQTTELQNMVSMLTSAVGAVAATGAANTLILTNIEKQVAVVSDLNDVRLMKARLSGCLANIRMEAARQRTETEKTIQELRRGLSQFQSDRTTHVSAPGVANGDDDGPNPDLRAELPTRLRPEVPLSELAKGVSIRSRPSWSPTSLRH
jgi:hypothetical protein